MTPQAFLRSLKPSRPPAGVLLLGSEGYYRDRCREALKQAAAAGGEEPGGELIEFDLSEQPLSALVDEARALSLFSSARLIVGRNAEAALPRGAAARAAEPPAGLKDYFRQPPPAVVVLLEATRYNWNDRDEKSKIDRVARFFQAVPSVVELKGFSAQEAVAETAALAKQHKLKMEPQVVAELVETLGNDMRRLASEVEKLSVYAGEDGAVTSADIEMLIPEARQSGLFELSGALAKKDAGRALSIVDALAHSGAYWPMQITLLASLFRHALAVQQQRPRSANDVVRLFQQRGLRMWAARARQLLEMARRFSPQQLEGALQALFEADRDLRRERPDERMIIERLIVKLAA